MIRMGIQFGGAPSNYSPCGKLLKAAVRYASDAFRPTEGPSIQLVFFVAGQYGAPDWEHGRLGHYSPEKKVLDIDLAITKALVDNPEPLDEIILELRGVNALAFEFFRRIGERFELRAAEAMVTELEARLRPN